MTLKSRQLGFSLVEMLVATTVFTFVAASTSSLFVTALDLQRRAIGIQKIQENAQFALESIAREVRVSIVTSPDASCDPIDPVGTRTLTIEHPTNGTVTYEYDTTTDIAVITRDAGGSGPLPITSSDVNFTFFAFCVTGSGDDDIQTRVTMPMTIESMAGRPSTRAKVSLQTTIVSRDLSTDF